MCKRVGKTLAGLVFILLCCGFSEPKGLGLAQSFEEIALKNEYGEERWRPVRKWRAPIKLYLDSRVGDTQLQHRLVNQQIRTLIQATGHPIEQVKQPEQANLYLLFERELKVPHALQQLTPSLSFSSEFLNSSVCFGSLTLAADSTITHALVVIPPDKARYRGKLNSCVIEELTQVMGLINDSDRVYPSIFNDHSIDQELSGLDLQLLKLLYHPRVRPGMTREEVMPIIHELSDELNAPPHTP